MILTSDSGGEKENFVLTMGPNTGVFYSCSAKLNGSMYVLGGYESNQRRQVFL